MPGRTSAPDPRVAGHPGDTDVHHHEEVHDDGERLVEDMPVVEELAHPLPEQDPAVKAHLVGRQELEPAAQTAIDRRKVAPETAQPEAERQTC